MDETLLRRIFAGSVVRGLTAAVCRLGLGFEIGRPRKVVRSSSVSVVVSPSSVFVEEAALERRAG